MTSRLPLWLSLLTLAATVAAFVLLRDQLVRANRRLEAIERRLESSSRPPAPEGAREATGEARRESARAQGAQAIERAIEADLAALVKKLEAGPDLEGKLREAIRPEIDCFLEAVEQSLAALFAADPKPEDDRLSSVEFRKELEEKIGETDAKARDLLTAFQLAVFEQWRIEFRKNRYKLE